MCTWAGPLARWDQANFGKEVGYWYSRPLYGDTTFSVPLTPQNVVNGLFAVVLNTDGATAFLGYEVTFAARNGGIDLALLRQGITVARAHVKAPPASEDIPPQLVVHRQGCFLYAGIDDVVSLSYRDPEPLDGCAAGQALDDAPAKGGHVRLGLVIRGLTALDIANVEVDNRRVYDDTFHLAPSNWRPQSGNWEMTDRWTCQPSWTWYGGADPAYAVAWSKSSLWGDQQIDFHTGVKMGATPTSGTEAMRDLNCSWCADGTDLFSGYTLILGGVDGTKARLYRKGKLVAEVTMLGSLQAIALSCDGGGSMRGVHGSMRGVHVWFEVRVTRTGGRIQAILNCMGTAHRRTYPLFDWTDPDPLPGGYFSFWTYNNGIVVARATLSAQRWGASPVYSAQPEWLSHQPAGAPYPG